MGKVRDECEAESPNVDKQEPEIIVKGWRVFKPENEDVASKNNNIGKYYDLKVEGMTKILLIVTLSFQCLCFR